MRQSPDHESLNNLIKVESKQDLPNIQLKKRVVRKTKEDGFFRTGVEVTEHEEIDGEATTHAAL